MNSRTIHSFLFFAIVSVFFIMVTHVHAQNMDNQEDEISEPVPSQPTQSVDAHISSQLPILSSDVGEIISPKSSKAKKPITTPTEPPTITKVQEKKTVSPTVTPSEQPEKEIPSETSSSTAVTMTNTGGLDPEKLFSMSNEYRKSKGLPEFKKDDKTCSLAASRAPEVSAEVASGDMHKGLRDRNLDYWNTENIISMRTEESAFNWWVNDKIHHDALVGNFTYSCVACSGNSCAQEFTNYQAK